MKYWYGFSLTQQIIAVNDEIATSLVSQTPPGLSQNQEPGSSLRQTTLSSRFHPPNKNEVEKITEGLANMLAVTGTPYLFVETEGFKKFMNIVTPLYKIPCRTTFSERCIPKLYSKVHETLKMRLRDVPYMSLTSDGWTGCNMSQFVSVTATYIDDNWVLKTVTLACRELNESHTSANVADLINDVLCEYNINKSRISAITTDRGANFVKAVVTDLKLNHIPCFGHVLNNFVQKVILNKFVTDIIIKVKGLYTVLKSSAARRKLGEIQVDKQSTICRLLLRPDGGLRSTS